MRRTARGSALAGLAATTLVLTVAALVGTDGVGATDVTIANQCLSPAAQVVQYGLSTVSEPTAEQMSENPVAFDLAGSVDAPARVTAGTTFVVRATIEVDLQATAERQLVERVRPQVIDSGFPQLTGTAHLNLAIDDLVARFPLPAHTSVVGAPTATSTGPAAHAAVDSGVLTVHLDPLRTGAYSVSGAQDGTTSTTHPAAAPFTVTVEATVAVAAGTPAGTALVLRPGGMTYDLDTNVGVYFFGKLVSGGAAGPQVCTPEDPGQVLATTVVDGPAGTTTSTVAPTTTHGGHDHPTTTAAAASGGPITTVVAPAPTGSPTTTAAPTTTTTTHAHTSSPTIPLTRVAPRPASATTDASAPSTSSAEATGTDEVAADASPDVVVDPSAAAPGDTVEVRSPGWSPGSNVVAVLHSDPVLLGIRTADDAGVLDARFELPANLPAGRHRIELTGAAADGTARTATAELTVAGPSPAVVPAGLGGVADGHAHTTEPAEGAEAGLFFGMVVLLTVAGFAVVAALRSPSPVAAPATGVPAGTVVARVVAACSAGAGLLHLLAAGDHLDLSASHGAFFVVVGWLQVGLAAALLTRRAPRPVLLAGALANLGVLGVWLVSRTIGVAGEIEAVGTADLLAVVLGTASIVGCIVLLSGVVDGVAVGASPAGAWAGAATTAVVLLVTASLLPGVATEHDHGTAELASAGHEHTGDAADDGHAHDPGAATLAGTADEHADDHGDDHADDHGDELAGGAADHGDDHDHDTTTATTARRSTTTTAHADDHDHDDAAAATTTTVHDDGHDHDSSVTTAPATTSTTAHDHATTTTTAHTHGTTTTTTPPPVEAWRLGATDTEVALTWQLIADTQAVVATFTSIADAESKGFVRIADDHMVNVDRMLDDQLLEPDAIESLVVAKVNGVDTIVGGMYLLNIGHDESDIPALGGPLLVWHRHGGFCFDENLNIVGTGPCGPNTMFIDDPPMIHVWSDPMRWSDGTARSTAACGTFAYLDVPHDDEVPGCVDPSGHHHDH